MKKLFAFFEGKLIGTIIKDEEDVYSFEYDEEWKEFDLSLSMPVSQKKFGNKITLSFFENLLPEGEVKKSLEFHHKIKSVYDFLDHFGQDLAGALVVSDNPNFPGQAAPLEKIEIDMGRVYQAIKDKSSVAEALSEMNPGYLSLAGAQDKFPAIYEEGRFFLPKNGGATTHIVKTPILRSGIEDSVFNEYFCMTLASKIGLNVPKCFIVKGPSNDHLFVIERYDRVKSNHEIKRIHQQDFCQALGYLSTNKYEHMEGPSFKDCFDLILTNVDPITRYQCLSQLLDWLCFNFLIGNNDAHGKNLSLLLKDNRITLAPFYDLISTEIYPKLLRKFSFKIGDRDIGHEIGKNQFNLLEKSLGIKENVLVNKIKEMGTRILENKDEILKSIAEKYGKVSTVHKINDFILRRIKGLKNQRI